MPAQISSGDPDLSLPVRVLRKESGGPASPAQPTSSLIGYRRYRAEIQKLIAATALAASSLYTRNLDDFRGIEHLLTTVGIRPDGFACSVILTEHQTVKLQHPDRILSRDESVRPDQCPRRPARRRHP